MYLAKWIFFLFKLIEGVGLVELELLGFQLYLSAFPYVFILLRIISDFWGTYYGNLPIGSFDGLPPGTNGS